METKSYKIKINLPKQKVWDIMIGKETYSKWIKGFSMNSQIVGEWKQSSQADFLDPEMGGTRAILDIVDKPNRILVRHTAVLDKDRKILQDEMDNWVGTLEEYLLSEENNLTTVKIVMKYHKDYEKMLDEGWNKSLKLLKELCEKNLN